MQQTTRSVDDGPLASAADPAPVPRSSPPAAPAAGVVDERPLDVERRAWTFGSAEGTELLTEHFAIRTTVDGERNLIGLPMLQEGALRHYMTALGDLPAPRGIMQTYLFDRRSEWETHTRAVLGRSAGPYLRMGRGGYTTEGQTVLYNLGRNDTSILLVHEGWHEYTQVTFRDALPVWLEEGIACYMEGHRFRWNGEEPTFLPWRNFERFGELRSAVRNDRLIPLETLLNGSPQSFLSQGRTSLLTYYAQVWVLVHFLVEAEDGRYRDNLHTLVLDAAEGRLEDRMRESGRAPRGRYRRLAAMTRGGKWVAQEYLNENLEELSASYDQFVREVVAGSGRQIWSGRSPR